MDLSIDTPTLRNMPDPLATIKLAPAPSPKTAISDPVNVIIPIGGIGSRFSKQGYRFPKPLINIVGRPMLLWLIDNLTLKSNDTLWMAVNEEVDDEFRIGQLVSKTFPKIDFRLLRLRHQTKGASETLYIVTQSMNEQELARKTVSLDCDTIYWADILQTIRGMPKDHGGCFYFRDYGNKPIFSYLKTENKSDKEVIVDIQEKKAVSNKANTGAYVFPSAATLKKWCAHNLDAIVPDQSQIGEYYTSQTIALMLKNQVPFIGLHIDQKEFSVVGTPEQLQVLLRLLKSGSNELPVQIKKRRFCFDLDMTLVGVPAVTGDYSTCPPIEKNIRLVQQLYKAGHYIIIQTARRMRTHKGNMGSVIADIGPVTFAQLAKYEIPYHDIHFGKPYADVYVDDLAVNANLDTMKEIGWLLDEQDAEAALIGEGLQETTTKKTGMIAARDFNSIQVIGDKVIKSSRSIAILGELFFYSHMPPAIAKVFPTIYSVDFIPNTSTYSITMENRRGLTFSHLLVGRSITSGRLTAMLQALHAIHTTDSTSEPTTDIPPALAERFEQHSLKRVNHLVNIYGNYGSKLRSRYYGHQERYDALGPLSASLFARINEFLDTYEAEEHGVHAQVIHGDPVFSNVIFSSEGRAISFIDVRCQLDQTLTPEGDVYYDLGKVLQSLCGYDHILFKSANDTVPDLAKNPDAPLLDDADLRLLAELRNEFFEFVEKTYAVRIHRKTLYRITASLFFSLIPLHRPSLGLVFLRMCKETLDKASEITYGLGARSYSSTTPLKASKMVPAEEEQLSQQVNEIVL